jgi:hypothetical protein
MKLSHGFGYAGGLCAVSLALATVACSSSSSSGSDGGGGGGGDTCQSSGVNCITAPAAPSGGTPTSAKHNYAIHKLYLGDTDRSGVMNADAWKSYGFNLDNLVTTKASTDVCTLASGAAKTTQVDGNGGIDNSFGANIMPIVITTAGSDAANKINTSINTGSFTIMAFITGFDDTAGSMANATGLSGVVLAGGNYGSFTDGGTPSWNTSTHWPIRPELLSCGPNCPQGSDPVADAKIKFPMAYQANGTFVNGSPADIDISLTIGGQALDLSIHSAVITFQPAGTGHVTNGNIAGVINTAELIQSLKGVAGHISTSLCSGSAFDSISQQITQASDIHIDGSTVSNNNTVACNGISVGIGFDADEIAAPTAADIAGPTPPAADPCSSDAGTGAD